MTFILKMVNINPKHLFEPIPSVEQSTHTPIEVQEIFIKPDKENLAQKYDTQKTLTVTQMDKSKLSLENATPEEISHFEQKLMSLPELTLENIIQLKKMITFCNTILQVGPT